MVCGDQVMENRRGLLKLFDVVFVELPGNESISHQGMGFLSQLVGLTTYILPLDQGK